ncbi:uncharacterized protein F5Z01DRAFT_634173 [Emericellopsis atlantica]|uniref:BTB domain-containing protein n=1 Tax=Emericellopsis atlantica TaxID=2614577 RepID=A0A9P8CRX8_9HYPO|nr:uncharacterized protein F5Z01DRAFT_634173 [Emericellopsis atlantica]KAG9256590.1 hypothetical protein F5Z01DRAFT_634173 [Emericellopsis atlantica]
MAPTTPPKKSPSKLPSPPANKAESPKEGTKATSSSPPVKVKTEDDSERDSLSAVPPPPSTADRRTFKVEEQTAAEIVVDVKNLIPSEIPATLANEQHESLKTLYCDTLFTDLTIACKDQTFNVHKVVVCTQSSVLRRYAMDTANFTDGFLVMRISRADLMQAAIQFLYLKVYELPSPATEKKVWSTKPKHSVAEFLFNLELYDLADKLDLPNLKTSIVQQLAKWNTYRRKVVNFPTFHKAINFITDNISNKNDPIHDAVANVLVRNKKALRTNDMLEWLKVRPEMILDLLTRI